MKRLLHKFLPAVCAMFAAMCLVSPAYAFCGFYVAKADTGLFNTASKVIMARADNRTVMTMANDFQGDVEDFAIVIPVPTIITENQVNVTENSIIEHLDAYTAPRLVEYYDSNPCAPPRIQEMAMMRSAAPQAAGVDRQQKAKALGVTIEAEYSVGEYDIVILSAEQSDGLQTFLDSEGYKVPENARKVLGSYIKQDMKFFLAKVDLEKFESEGYQFLRPLQVAYESEKFMLPVRLGTVNSKGPQDIILFTLTKKGRVEPVNYRTVKIPSDKNIPLYVENEFGDFYKAMFTKAAEREDMEVMFLEYAWNMSWCDPCAADPLPNKDLRTLGAWWVSDDKGRNIRPGRFAPGPAPVDVFVTRLHARYTAESFPADIQLQETSDTKNFQGRYILQHPWDGEAECKQADVYYQKLPERFEEEAKTLANLTGWKISDIREKMASNGQPFDISEKREITPWWERIWSND